MSRQKRSRRRATHAGATTMSAGTPAGTTAGGGGPIPPPGAPPFQLPFPLPPTFPPGVNPFTYKVEEVTRLLKSAAYFPIFNVPNPNNPNQPVPLIPGLPFLQQYLMIAVEVNEQLHRFEVNVEAPTAGRGFRSSKAVGEPVANVHIRFTPIPNNFEAAPGLYPPPTILNPFVSQRFSMLDGQLSFMDADGSGFRAFGTARSFPVSSQLGQLRVGAVIDILEGLGKLQGLSGTAVINGYIRPPNDLALNLMVRFMDPSGRLRARSRLAPIRPIADPDPDAVFLFFLGENDPDTPTQPILGPPGGPPMLGAHVHELLRLVHLGFDLGTASDLRSRTLEGPIVGRVDATLWFNAFDPRSVFPIQTTDGVFTFFDRGGQTVGSINANMVEGRAMRTPLAGAPMDVYRFGGFGPLLGGAGQFAGADGMMSMNSVISLMPQALSNLYIFRLVDTDGRFRAAAQSAWS